MNFSEKYILNGRTKTFLGIPIEKFSYFRIKNEYDTTLVISIFLNKVESVWSSTLCEFLDNGKNISITKKDFDKKFTRIFSKDDSYKIGW